MATIYNFQDELTASTAKLQPTDKLLVYDAAGSVVKAMPGSLVSSAAGVVATTATTLTITEALHAGRTVIINSTSPIAITLPQATGTGNRYRFFVGVLATATAHTIKVANATDNMIQALAIFNTSATDITAISFCATATDDTISLNGTTKGGYVGAWVDIDDVATGVFRALYVSKATGSYATPFSATVS